MVPEGVPETPEGHREKTPLTARHGGGRLRDAPQDRDREHQPPDGDREEREAGAELRAEREDHADVDGEQQTAAEVAHGKPHRGNPVLVLLPGDMRRQGVVEDVAAGEAQPRDHEEERGHEPVAGRHEDEQRGPEAADENRGRQQFLLAPLEVGDGAEDRGEDGNEQQRDRQGRRPVGRRRRRARQRLAGHLAVVDGENRRQDGGGEGGVGPVVELPGPDAAPVLGLVDPRVPGDHLRHEPSCSQAGRGARLTPRPAPVRADRRSSSSTSAGAPARHRRRVAPDGTEASSWGRWPRRRPGPSCRATRWRVAR